MKQHCPVVKATFERETLVSANDANQSFNSTLTVKDIACEQAFRGALGVGRERKETLQNLNICIGKIDAKC